MSTDLTVVLTGRSVENYAGPVARTEVNLSDKNNDAWLHTTDKYAIADLEIVRNRRLRIIRYNSYNNNKLFVCVLITVFCGLLTKFTHYFLQVSQLSQRDHAAGWVSLGQKWKTETGRQYFADIIGLYSTIVT